MGRKAVVSGGKRDEIISVARKMFFEKGFDGVTIRTLQKAVGCEVGLFYYYFKSKDEVFEVVVEQMESEWKVLFDEIIKNVGDDAKACLDDLFGTLAKIAADFRSEGGENLHWSVQGGIMNRLVELTESYVEIILGEMGVRGSSIREQAIVVSGGLGRLAVAEKSNGYKERIDYVLTAAGVQGYSYNRRREISVELL